MSGIYNGSWVPFKDQMGRQGWYNQTTGQTTYQTYGGGAEGYSAAPMMAQPAPIPIQQPVYQPVQVPVSYVPQMVAPTAMMTQIPQMPQMTQMTQMPQMPQMPQIAQVPQMQQMQPIPHQIPPQQQQHQQQQQQQHQQQQQQQQVPPPGWQPMIDRSGRRYFYNPATGQSVYN